MLRFWIDERFHTNKTGATTNIRRERKNNLQHQDTRMLHLFKDCSISSSNGITISISIRDHLYLS